METSKIKSNLAPDREKRGDFPSEFRDFSDFGHSYPAVEVDEFRDPSAEADRFSKIAAQRGEHELKGNFLLPTGSCGHRRHA